MTWINIFLRYLWSQSPVLGLTEHNIKIHFWDKMQILVFPFHWNSTSLHTGWIAPQTPCRCFLNKDSAKTIFYSTVILFYRSFIRYIFMFYFIFSPSLLSTCWLCEGRTPLKQEETFCRTMLAQMVGAWEDREEKQRIGK